MLHRLPYIPRHKMRDWQFQRICRMVEHAYSKIPFYRDLYDGAGFRPRDLRTWDDFTRLPVVTKDSVISNYPSRMLEVGYDLDRLIVSRSSGSTGKVLDIAYDQRAMSTFILAGFRLYRMGFPYRPWHKQVYIYTSPYPLRSVFGLYPLHFVSTLTPVSETAAVLRRERPALLVCYPSHLRQIAQQMPDRDRRALGLKLISVNSEMSTQAERDELKRQFGCPVLDEYSSEELTRIAAQCLSGHYHLFEDINYMEVLDDQGQATDGVGVLTGTNLHNFAMPMIRYRQNDLGRIEESTCSCGWRFRCLTQLEGRRNDSFVMPSGKVLSSGFLLDATYDFLLAYRTAVREFCLVQESPASVSLQIVPGASWNSETERKIAARFEEFLEPGVSFRVEIVTECEKTATGKRNPIVSRVSKRS
jgi:phenylacetate-CoA ligase